MTNPYEVYGVFGPGSDGARMEFTNRGWALYDANGDLVLPVPPTAEDALDNLRALVMCRCDEAWTARGRHEPNAACDYADDVEILAAELRRLEDEAQG